VGLSAGLRGFSSKVEPRTASVLNQEKLAMKAELKAKYLQHLVHKNGNEGKTWVKVVVALLLLGIASAIALPSFLNQANKAQLEMEMERAEMNPRPMVAVPAVRRIPGTESTPAVSVPRSISPDSAIATEVPQAQPQLIKKAALSIVVESIDKSFQSISAIVKKQQGYILSSQDSQPQDPSTRPTGTMQIRVPQEKLDATLDALAKLGTVQNRLITVEDFSNQIVDYTVRLRNLRKSEEMVLKIMERSGSVRDVLYAAQNLREIRELIERIEAQLKSLRTQVAYSTITISLEEAVAATPPSQQPLGLRVQETWGKSTHAMSEFTLGLLSLSIWLFTFSPYLLLGGAAVYGYRKFRRQKSDLSAQKAELPPAVDAQSKI
jgi:chemotaxis protein histidine kinase CheA